MWKKLVAWLVEEAVEELANIANSDARDLPAHRVEEYRRRGWTVGYLTTEDGARQVPVVLDGLGRPIGKPHLPRASASTVLPAGYTWNHHEKAGSRAAERRKRQLERRGLRLCAQCDTIHPIVNPENVAAFRPAPGPNGPILPGYYALVRPPWHRVGDHTWVCDGCFRAMVEVVRAQQEQEPDAKAS